MTSLERIIKVLGAPWGSDWDVGGVALAVGLWEGGLISGGILGVQTGIQDHSSCVVVCWGLSVELCSCWFQHN